MEQEEHFWDKISVFGIGHNHFKDIVGYSGDVQKQLDTWLWKSVVYSGLKIDVGLILQEIKSVVTLNRIIAQRERQTFKQLTAT